jgi:hypothetical protein
MIDINELRRKVNSTDIVDHIDLHANIRPLLSELIDRLEAAEKERDWHAGRCEDTMNECDALHAHIEAMEQQEPVGCVESLFDDFVIIHHSFDRAAPVYLAPGAQPAPSVPTDVITDYLVSISAHLAHQDDRKAQAEIGELLKMLASARSERLPMNEENPRRTSYDRSGIANDGGANEETT